MAFVPFGIADGQVPAARIMALGDSLTFGNNDINYPNGDIPGGFRKALGSLLTNGAFPFDFVGTLATNAAPGMDPDHEGHPGFRTDQILTSVPAWLEAKPDVVLLMIGSNDVIQGVPVATAAANLDSLIGLILATDPNRRLYVSTIPPISGTVSWYGQTPAQMNANAVLYNVAVRNLVQEHANL
jgi:acyl-CoA thioesterase-1